MTKVDWCVTQHNVKTTAFIGNIHDENQKTNANIVMILFFVVLVFLILFRNCAIMCHLCDCPPSSVLPLVFLRSFR